MKNCKVMKTQTNKLTLKGLMSDDATFVTFLDDDKVEQEITIAECMNKFAGQPVDITITLKSDEEIEVEDFALID